MFPFADVQEGYSPNDTDNMGNTATHLAAANGHEVRPAQFNLGTACSSAAAVLFPPAVLPPDSFDNIQPSYQ